MQTDTQVQDKLIEVRGLSFHYREWGNAGLPPVLIFHGITGHAWEFDQLASALSCSFHVLVISQRGHGASSWAAQYSPHTMAEDIAGLIDAFGFERVRIIGHSMGGVNSWIYAATHPEKLDRLVLQDITPDVITSDDVVAGMTMILREYAQAHYADPQEAVSWYMSGSKKSNPGKLREFVLKNLASSSEGIYTWRFDAKGLQGWIKSASSDPEMHWSALRKIVCPALVVRAGNSHFTGRNSVERMVQALPNGLQVEIPGSTHDIHIERCEELVETLCRFLTE
ncbi:MAG: alpha/beta fold hydrolase [Chitinivibrionales bacterium]